ncbi:MAG: phosphate signaling complex protein PhoU [Actinobacteria bacterium]|nr:phosphate signaling complex protein PhoU [Actinomycetota bacterium]
MRKTFHEELKELQAEILRMGDLAVSAVTKSIKSLIEGNIELADEVIIGDDEVDKLNLDIEEASMHILARQQPVAKDLRLIHAVLLITVHLERIGDYALNIAKITKRLNRQIEEKTLLDLISEMGSLSCSLVNKSLQAFDEKDAELATSLSLLDEPIDHLYKRFLKELKKSRDDEDFMGEATELILASRYLERVADHAVDIGERVTFLVTGEFKEVE